MKTQIKDIVIGIFAVIGFTAVVMGFTNQSEPQQTYGTPESHEWGLVVSETDTDAFLYNKKTGETWGLRRTGSSQNWRSPQQIK